MVALSDKCLSALMWIFTIILTIGVVMTFVNTKGKILANKYEGSIISLVGLIGSVVIGMVSKKSRETFMAIFE
jgi:uncharacterized protein YybS (DUF2232 family)